MGLRYRFFRWIDKHAWPETFHENSTYTISDQVALLTLGLMVVLLMNPTIWLFEQSDKLATVKPEEDKEKK